MGQGGNFNGAFSKPDDNETIGITLTVPIWDWGARKANIRSTELSNENTEISNEEERKSIMLDVRQICRECPNYCDKSRLPARLLKTLNVRMTSTLRKYRSGTHYRYGAEKSTNPVDRREKLVDRCHHFIQIEITGSENSNPVDYQNKQVLFTG